VTSRETFLAVPDWVDTVKKASATAKMVLVANKKDLTLERKVSVYEAETLATKMDLPFFETSARMENGIEDLFAHICHLALDNKPVVKETDIRPSTNAAEPVVEGSRCCLLL
jgi:GTPase SAR1 family protein